MLKRVLPILSKNFCVLACNFAFFHDEMNQQQCLIKIKKCVHVITMKQGEWNSNSLISILPGLNSEKKLSQIIISIILR